MNEAQVRPLISLKTPEDQALVWQAVIETAPEGKITSAHVVKTVKQYRGEKTETAVRNATNSAQSSELPQAFKDLFSRLVDHIRTARTGLGKRQRKEMCRYINTLTQLLED
jgi:hypothetical protein